MKAPVDFWFAFGSPAGYIASHRIDDIASRHGRSTRWRPFNIRAVLEAEGIKPNVMYERKGRYTRHDWVRTARLRQVPFRLPEPFPRNGIPSMTVYYWIEEQFGYPTAKQFAKNVMRAFFAENAAIDEPGVLGKIASLNGVDRDAAQDAAASETARKRLDEATAEASRLGVWGSPFVIVDGEPFWGEDRLDQVDLWLERGGW